MFFKVVVFMKKVRKITFFLIKLHFKKLAKNPFFKKMAFNCIKLLKILVQSPFFLRKIAVIIAKLH